MQSALAIVQYEADMATEEGEHRRLRSATTRLGRPLSPTADVTQTDMAPDEANPDLTAANNYVDNHVDHTVADVV